MYGTIYCPNNHRVLGATSHNIALFSAGEKEDYVHSENGLSWHNYLAHNSSFVLCFSSALMFRHTKLVIFRDESNSLELAYIILYISSQILVDLSHRKILLNNCRKENKHSRKQVTGVLSKLSNSCYTDSKCLCAIFASMTTLTFFGHHQKSVLVGKQFYACECDHWMQNVKKIIWQQVCVKKNNLKKLHKNNNLRHLKFFSFQNFCFSF